jgi:hypothetical protein
MHVTNECRENRRGGKFDRLVPVATLENVIRGKTWAWKNQPRRTSKRKKNELDLLRTAEIYRKLGEKIPTEIVEQLK